ncbi:DMT family transporter [Halalkalibacillus halophilus]|uniref:DMT family transporter n=1 Tax=Halalkalibacillus halophilus TaxID=392827 RepID=UPI0003FBF383|nr:multidrug efflux SMR transporter [Halalkalibacillus halophilus]
MKSVILLSLAILFEVFGSSMLKISQGFTQLYPSLGVIIGYLASFTLLGVALKEMALSIAYAVWAAMGTALTAMVGIFFLGEEINVLKGMALVLIIFGVFLLNHSKAEPKQIEG